MAYLLHSFRSSDEKMSRELTEFSIEGWMRTMRSVQLSAQDQRDASQGRGLGNRDGMALLEAADGLFGHDHNSTGALMGSAWH